MSENSTTLTAEQSSILYRIDKAVNAVMNADIASIEPLKEARENLTSVTSELREVFPTVFAQAREYYYAEEEPEVEMEGFECALFSSMLSLIAITEKAQTFGELASACDGFYQDWADLLSYSDEWDGDHGCWKQDNLSLQE